MGGYDIEGTVTIVVLLVLIIIYLYLLLSPTQPQVPSHRRNFVIPEDTLANFQSFAQDPSADWKPNEEFSKESSVSSGGQWTSSHDDFFLDQNAVEGGVAASFEDTGPIVPSSNFRCGSDWVSIRSQLNYKFLWMHTSNFWMNAGATSDTPIHHKSFQLQPVEDDCGNGGWVLLKEGDSNKFIYMVPPNEADAWVVKMGSTDLAVVEKDQRYHFLMENEGYILNRQSMAFVNVMPDSDFSVRGHSDGMDRTKPARREYNAAMQFEFVNATLVAVAIKKEAQEENEALEQDRKYIEQINLFPASSEKRVISFGLYGKNPKYTTGALRNVEAAKIYFPGWVCRFYVSLDVPTEVLDSLKEQGAEISPIPPNKGYVSGMFWRFLVADDPTVDRYLVRDTDSRMNARDRLAVEDWIESKYPVHIMRDHVNHCLPMNGGMWGGVKGAIPQMTEKINAWENRDEYASDLNFLEMIIWPEIRDNQIAHDSYCCDRFPNARPFPSKRPMTYQHVGQVFDADGNARLNDIDGYIRGVPVPGSCRKHADWIYG